MPTATKAEIGERMREARLRAGLSQVKLAAILGITQNDVSRWECGRVTPGPHYRARISEALDRPELFDDGEPEEPV